MYFEIMFTFTNNVLQGYNELDKFIAAQGEIKSRPSCCDN